MLVQESCDRCLKLMIRNLLDQSLICEIAVLMGCFLESSPDVPFVQGTFDILEVCIDAMVICQNGASVHTVTDVIRVKRKWKIPEETSNEYLLKENWKRKIEEVGGRVHPKLKKDTDCLGVIGTLDHQDSEMKKARRMKVPVVREDYLVDSINRKKKLPFDLYKLEAYGETQSMVTVKVKGRSAVHESSGLQDTGHILEDKISIFNTTLNMSDLSTGINSYYILQIIEEDKGLDCYVSRKWGRVGSEKIGGDKLEEMSKSDAIQEFKRFEALPEIKNLLSGTNHDPTVKETLLVDASNRFFTVIPSIHPHVIKDEDEFKLKIKMLEALQDIEIASRLVVFDIDNDDSLDEKYKKLQCDISPLPHQSEDYRVIEKYLQSAHAPIYKDWVLEVEEVFSLEREGEFDKFKPCKEKLKNRMLLWHGSRLTNFVGILSQGLRIAPPEAPATGYMFGKGTYFADMVSKIAQSCFTDHKNPVGFMLLSEVALGEVYELKADKYMDNPPKGKHSTKGLGKTVPERSEFVNWRDEVVVPCGKPVPSNVKNSVLLYNEYIVYDATQGRTALSE
ncbi:hypothetical protein K7X08_016403 [Anisodus acutangulus]|uniref:Poly [ADP-ribose] polymerase n=1 Tax=Anisodus acutangulus TaxID=402998 RepID=A0A9Q1LDP1_9SOLA|nr:hypothetical protein K7X08_016403 [Anisodus acutangulus]